MKLYRFFFTVFFISYMMVTSAWGMLRWNDADNYPWSHTLINLGITGAQAKVSDANLQALEVAHIYSNTPAHGKLQIGDLVVGANGKEFQTDINNGNGESVFGGEGPTMDFGNALEESQGSNGILSLKIQRNNTDMTVKLNIGTKYGKYSDTFPYNCPKTELILSELYPFIASQQTSDGNFKGGGGNSVTFLSAMALLSSGESKYLPHVKRTVEMYANRTDSDPSDEMSGLKVWHYNFAGILLSEYYLVTKEAWVIQELEEIKTWLLKAQFTDFAQQLVTSHGLAHEKQKGGWGHNPGFEGYGPMNFQTSLALTALSLIKRCGINTPWDRMELGYQAMEHGTAQNGYVWYSRSVNGGATGWAGQGRTGGSAVSNYLAPSSDSKYAQMAKLNAKCIGYDNRYKSFPDGHASPHLNMVQTAWGALLDNQGFLNLMNYHRWWFSLSQSHNGNHFVSQPNRDTTKGGLVIQSAVMALVFSTKNKTLHVTGRGGGNFDTSGGGGNNSPLVNIQNLQVKNDTTLNITLIGYDSDGDALTYSVQSNPGHGTLSGSTPNLTYTPDNGYTGPDSFTFSASDGTASSAEATINITITGTGTGTGKITRQLWNGIPGDLISDFTGNANYPHNPDTTNELGRFSVSCNSNKNAGVRITGYLHPPVSGTYTFWIASARNSELWLSTDDSAQNKQKIANVSQNTNDFEWSKFPEQQSTSITLTAGRRYYIEALWKAGPWFNHIAVAWQPPGGGQEVIHGRYLSPFVGSTNGTGAGSGAGKITQQVWNGIPGITIPDLTGSANYPDNPDTTDELDRFEAPENVANDYGTRIIGYIHPSVSGTYTFWIASDDNGELWLSTDDSAQNRQKIANVSDWTGAREWARFPEQQSGSITLKAGRRYYIEALMKEGGGGDHLAVAWQPPGGTQEVIPGSYLSPFVGSTDGTGGGTDDGTDDTTDIGAGCFVLSIFAD